MSDSAQPFNPQHGNFPPPDFAPTEDERNFAMLAEVLQLFAGFIPPLVIYLVKRNSRFVAFHALQALFWQIAYFVIIMLGMVIFFASVIGTMAPQFPKGMTNKAPPVGLFVGMGALWLVLMAGWLVNLILAIYFGVKAHQGQWAAYPILGRWARQIVSG